MPRTREERVVVRRVQCGRCGGRGVVWALGREQSCTSCQGRGHTDYDVSPEEAAQYVKDRARELASR